MKKTQLAVAVQAALLSLSIGGMVTTVPVFAEDVDTTTQGDTGDTGDTNTEEESADLRIDVGEDDGAVSIVNNADDSVVERADLSDPEIELLLNQIAELTDEELTNSGYLGDPDFVDFLIEKDAGILTPSQVELLNSANADDVEGDDAEGDDAEGDDAEGDDAEGDDAEGDDAEGDDAEGDDAEGDDAEGDDAEGDDAEGDDAEGDDAEGDDAEGDDAEGDDAEGDDAEGDDAEGDDAEGDDAEGDDAEGDDAEGDDAEGDDADDDSVSMIDDLGEPTSIELEVGFSELALEDMIILSANTWALVTVEDISAFDYELILQILLNADLSMVDMAVIEAIMPSGWNIAYYGADDDDSRSDDDDSKSGKKDHDSKSGKKDHHSHDHDSKSGKKDHDSKSGSSSGASWGWSFSLSVEAVQALPITIIETLTATQISMFDVSIVANMTAEQNAALDSNVFMDLPEEYLDASPSFEDMDEGQVDEELIVSSFLRLNIQMVDIKFSKTMIKKFYKKRLPRGWKVKVIENDDGSFRVKLRPPKIHLIRFVKHTSFFSYLDHEQGEDESAEDYASYMAEMTVHTPPVIMFLNTGNAQYQPAGWNTDADGKLDLDDTAVSEVTPDILGSFNAEYVGRLSHRTIRRLSMKQIGGFAAGAMGGFSSHMLMNVQPMACAGFTNIQISYMPVMTVASFTPMQVQYLSMNAMSAITGEHFMVMTDDAFGSFSVGQLNAIPAGEYSDLPTEKALKLIRGKAGLTQEIQDELNVTDDPVVLPPPPTPEDDDDTSEEDVKSEDDNDCKAESNGDEPTDDDNDAADGNEAAANCEEPPVVEEPPPVEEQVNEVITDAGVDNVEVESTEDGTLEITADGVEAAVTVEEEEAPADATPGMDIVNGYYVLTSSYGIQTTLRPALKTLKHITKVKKGKHGLRFQSKRFGYVAAIPSPFIGVAPVGMSVGMNMFGNTGMMVYADGSMQMLYPAMPPRALFMTAIFNRFNLTIDPIYRADGTALVVVGDAVYKVTPKGYETDEDGTDEASDLHEGEDGTPVIEMNGQEYGVEDVTGEADADDAIADDDAEGDDAEGDDAEGDDAEGDDAEGDDAEGDDAEGDDAEGDDAEGDDAEGDDAEGDDAEGDDAEGDDAEGDDAEGDDAEGDDAEGDDAEGDDAEGDDAEGDDAEGDDAEGDDAEGDDAEGDDAEGDDAEGDDAEGDDAEGDDAEGDDAEGDDAEGDDAEGDDAEGDDAEG
ncbi:hypothetical protein QUF74_19225, partial [Candidatus Halobeggiatoa sp. HSG11]|nr:hypothetical protein [Candidatus Halobeggiatoa sp. HSG11]